MRFHYRNIKRKMMIPNADTTPSQSMMRQALQAYADATNRGDADAIVALFARDAVIEDPVGSPPKLGDEVGEWFRASVALRAHIRPVAPIRGSCSNEAALVFEVDYNFDGRRLRTRTLDICVFNGKGLITSLRAYWGPEDVEDIGPAIP
jgi:steroid delta-isomerase